MPSKDKAPERAPPRGPWDADIVTVARGPLECAAMMRQGWRVYDAELLVHEIRPPRPGGRALREVVVYWHLGRRLDDIGDQAEVDRTLQEAQESHADAVAGAPQPEEPDDPGADAAPQVEAAAPEPAPLPGGRREKRKPGPARPGRQRAQGALGGVDTQGVRTS
jgi:hypothetical protein